MKIVVAPDSFKGNFSALQAASFIESGIKMADSNIKVVKVPVADGGEGTVEALVTATDGRIIPQKVHGPFMEEVDAFFGVLGDDKTGVVEMAACSGIMLIPEEKLNPLYTTTYGVGELILAAIRHGCTKIIVGLGGSATNDGGMGMAQALGVKFKDKNGNILGQGGRFLGEISDIDTTGLACEVKKVEIVAACDVKNPFFGPDGASYIYGPQKGASPETVEILDQGLRNLAAIIKAKLNKDISHIPGSGAAGGLGGGMIAFLDVQLCPGIDIIINNCNLEEIIKDCDLLITGEGRTDGQTANGKVPVGIASVAKRHNIPIVCLSGGLKDGYEEIYNHGIDAAFSNVTDAMTLEEALARSGKMLTQAAYALTRLVLKLKSKHNVSRNDIL